DRLGPAAEAHHARGRAALDVLGIDYEEDPTLVRGFDYYTRTVFEFTCGLLGAQSAVGGRGRYDRPGAERGGPPTPGSGRRAGGGVERVRLALGAGGVARPVAALDCYLAGPDEELKLELLPLLHELRDRGLSCESDLRGRSLKAMLRHAAGLGARHTVIVGPREHREGQATVRDMESGEQRTVPLEAARLAQALA